MCQAEQPPAPPSCCCRSPWEVLDYGEVVVHLMFAFEREHYNLEGKYARAVQAGLSVQQLALAAWLPCV